MSFARLRKQLAHFTEANAPDLYPETLEIPIYNGALGTDPTTGNQVPLSVLTTIRVRLMEQSDPRVRELLGVDEHTVVFEVKYDPANTLEFKNLPYGTRCELEFGGRHGTLTLIQPHLKGSADPARGYGLRCLATWQAPKRR